MKEIASNVYGFDRLVVGRVYLIKDPDGITLIDSGLPLAADRIVEQIEAAGHKVDDVKRLLVTHAHPDHAGGLSRLKELTGAQVIASGIERPVIEGEASLECVLPGRTYGLLRRARPSSTTFEGTPVDLKVNGGEVLPGVMGGMQVVSTPGHSPGHLSFWQPERRLLFCGDTLGHMFGRLWLSLPPFTIDAEENKRSVRKLAELNAETVCFGHGNPLVRNAARRMRRFAELIGPT